jgi:hypothetical protein
MRNKVICAFGKSEYFSKRGWTGNSQTSPPGKSEKSGLVARPGACSVCGRKPRINTGRPSFRFFPILTVLNG